MPLTDNLISYYKFDADSSADSADSNTGTDTAITYSAGNGKIGHGAGFNGTTSQISLGQPANLNFGTGPFSFSFWVKTTDTNQGGLIVNRAVGDTGYQVLNLTGKLYCDGVGTAGVTGSKKINDGVWHHCGVVFDRAGSLLRLYVDGNADGTTALGATSSNTTNNALFGNGYGFSTTFYNGAMDEIGIWNRVLNSQEISQLYNQGNGLQYPFTMTGNSHLNLLGVS